MDINTKANFFLSLDHIPYDKKVHQYKIDWSIICDYMHTLGDKDKNTCASTPQALVDILYYLDYFKVNKNGFFRTEKEFQDDLKYENVKNAIKMGYGTPKLFSDVLVCLKLSPIFALSVKAAKDPNIDFSFKDEKTTEIIVGALDSFYNSLLDIPDSFEDFELYQENLVKSANQAIKDIDENINPAEFGREIFMSSLGKAVSEYDLTNVIHELSYLLNEFDETSKEVFYGESTLIDLT